MGIDYSEFSESEEDNLVNFSDLNIDKQLELVTKAFPIGCHVNIVCDGKEISPFREWVKNTLYYVSDYSEYHEPSNNEKILVNVILLPVNGDTNRHHYMNETCHPFYLKLDNKWLRENKLKQLL